MTEVSFYEKCIKSEFALKTFKTKSENSFTGKDICLDTFFEKYFFMP